MFDSTLNIGIFSGVVVVILVILIFENRNKFKKPTLTSRAIGFIKYIALVIPLKPILTYIIYPFIVPRRVFSHMSKPFGSMTEREVYRFVDGDPSPLGYHFDNIFEYENKVFVYSFILVLILFLFFETRNYSSSSRIKKLKKLLNQGILTQEEFDNKINEIKEEKLKRI